MEGKITSFPLKSQDIAAAVEALRAGALVAFPTETVYGLGADAANGRAVAAIYSAKKRPAFNPLIAHVADMKTARSLGLFNAAAEKLAAAFWPGPLTLVLPAAPDCPVCDLARAGLPTVAVRMPAHPVAQELLRAFGGPLVAPSANRSGRISPTCAEHVQEELVDRVSIILNGGKTTVGLESTIIACVSERPRLLRPGGIPQEAIEEVLGFALEMEEHAPAAVQAPGQLTSHYAPSARVRLNAETARPGEVLLGFGATPGAALNLSPSGNLEEAAANLFAYLRQLDAMGAACIAIAPIPLHGLGAAINDRLQRAAAPRDIGHG